MKNAIIIMVFCLALTAIGQPFTTITHDITTEYGTYSPYSIDITPSVPDYTIAPGFSNVINFPDSFFTTEEEAALMANDFVVVPTQHCELFDIYNSAAGCGRFPFITTDFVLHTFHKLVSHLMENREKTEMFPRLCDLSGGMRTICAARLSESTDSICVEALNRNAAFFELPACILDGTAPTGMAADELDSVEAADSYHYSPIFGYALDYSQFIVRGNYADNDTLRRYFKAMMWFGLASFPVEDGAWEYLWHNDTIGTLQALMIAQTLESNATLAGNWGYVYGKSRFWAGSADDPTWEHYRDIAHIIYGAGFPALHVDSLKSHVGDFMDMATDSLPVPLIRSSSPPGMRFMGQRTTPGGIIFTMLTFYDTISGLDRAYPYGLDVPAALGCDAAYAILDTFYHEPELYPMYPERLDSATAFFTSLEDIYWVSSLHNNWVYSLMPLWHPKPAGYPLFMRSPEWEVKELTTSMSSWTELRHDMILYAKQSWYCTGMPPEATRCFAYVEPNPELYGRIAALCDYIIEAEDFTGEDIALTRFANCANRLKEIAEKELNCFPLTVEDYSFLTRLGPEFQAFSMDSLRLGDSPPWEPMMDPPDPDRSPLVADVHTTDAICLEEGTGYPAKIYVIVPFMGKLILTEGGVLPHYEFWNPISNRLTDSLWQVELVSDTPPLPDPWSMDLFASDVDFTRDTTDLWTWGLYLDLLLFNVMVEEDTPRVGDTVTISNSIYIGGWAGGSFACEYKVNWAGDSTVLTSDSTGVVEFPTAGLPVGWVQIWAEALDYEGLFFGTRFYMDSTLSIDEKPVLPEELTISAFPNPFNSAVSISAPVDATVEIFDVLGKSVDKLPGGNQIWKPEASVGSGIYLVRAKFGPPTGSGTETITKRVVYLK